MKYKWKKVVALFLVVSMFCMSVTGCGSASAAGDEVNAPIKLDAPEPIADETNDAESDDDADVPTQSDTVDDMESNDADNADAETETQDYSDNSANAENTSETSGKWQVYDPDLAAAIDADFEGSVQEMNADSFFILPEETTLLEDGSFLKVETAPGIEISTEDLVKVVFDSDTVFTLRDIYDGGERYEDSEVSFESIEKDISVALKGKFENDIFHANAVRIIKVHW